MGLGCASSVIGVLCLLTRANRRKQTMRVSSSAITVPQVVSPAKELIHWASNFIV